MNKALRIGIDGRPLQGRLTGIGRYIFEICKELDVLLPNATFYVYSQFPVELPVLSDRWVSRMDSWRTKRYLKSAIWLKLRCGELCAEDNLNYFWSGSTILPRISRDVKTIITVHDLNHLIVPQTMALSTLWSHRLFFNSDVRKANVVTANSLGTADLLMKHLGIRSDSVIYPSASNIYKKQTASQIDDCLKRYCINDKYILSVATWEPRKNLELLINTFLSMKNEGHLPHHRLVLVGGKGWKDMKLTKLISNDENGNIIPLGYVPELDLPPLYAGADVFLFPSIYEGFGMPVLEALLCGTQVVATNIPELREAGGDRAIYITPSEQGIRDGIQRALSNSSTKSDLIYESYSTSWHLEAMKLAKHLSN